MSVHFYLVFNLPGQTEKQYFVREAEKLVQGRPIIVPEISPVVRQAHKFNPESAVAFRDRYREQYARDGFGIFVEDNQGVRKFEREVQPEPETPEDTRTPYFYKPDGFEDTGLGYLIMPAIRPGAGRGWCVRARDIPSIANRDFETIYEDTPQDAIDKAIAAWGSLMVPSEAPGASERDSAEAKRILQDFEKSKLGPGRIRPGDR
jgi:hypothetical protein